MAIESYAGKINRKLEQENPRHRRGRRARRPADLVLKNATYVNVFSNELVPWGYRRGRGPDRRHGRLPRARWRSTCQRQDRAPRLHRRAHPPGELACQPHGSLPRPCCRTARPPSSPTRTRSRTSWAPTASSICFRRRRTCPSTCASCCPRCVPATPLDESGANLDYRAIDSFYDHPRVQGLAEMMNYRRRDQRRPAGRGEDRRRAGAPQEDRRPRAGPYRQGSQRLHRRGRLLRPRVLRSGRRH